MCVCACVLSLPPYVSPSIDSGVPPHKLEFPIRGRLVSVRGHFGQNDQKLRESYKINIFGQSNGETSQFFG